MKFRINTAMKPIAQRLLITCLASLASMACAMELRGDFTQGSLIRGKVEPGTAVFLNDTAVAVTPAGDFAIGFGRDAQLSHDLVTKQSNGVELHHNIELTPRTYNIQRINGIAPEIMQPSAENIARAQKDAVMVAEARAVASSRTDFLTDFIWPLTGRITGVYGSQRVYNDQPRRPHFGIDIAAPTGSNVKAPADGVVSLWVPDMFFSGGTMVIDHGYGVSSSFLHLSAALVEVGDEVSQGQAVAKVGSTGRSTGPHLDWRINWFAERLDPATVVGDMPNH